MASQRQLDKLKTDHAKDTERARQRYLEANKDVLNLASQWNKAYSAGDVTKATKLHAQLQQTKQQADRYNASYKELRAKTIDPQAAAKLQTKLNAAQQNVVALEKERPLRSPAATASAATISTAGNAPSTRPAQGSPRHETPPAIQEPYTHAPRVKPGTIQSSTLAGTKLTLLAPSEIALVNAHSTVPTTGAFQGPASVPIGGLKSGIAGYLVDNRATISRSAAITGLTMWAKGGAMKVARPLGSVAGIVLEPAAGAAAGYAGSAGQDRISRLVGTTAGALTKVDNAIVGGAGSVVGTALATLPAAATCATVAACPASPIMLYGGAVVGGVVADAAWQASGKDAKWDESVNKGAAWTDQKLRWLFPPD